MHVKRPFSAHQCPTVVYIQQQQSLLCHLTPIFEKLAEILRMGHYIAVELQNSKEMGEASSGYTAVDSEEILVASGKKEQNKLKINSLCNSRPSKL